MPYTINRTNGAIITVVNDGTINSSALDITLIGKNYTGYGEIFNENFVKLLENFSGNKPTKPLTGQLYYDSVNRKLEVYTNTGDTKWKNLGVMDVRSSAPAGPSSGDLWFNPNEQGGRLYVRNNTTREWILVGPINTRGAASGAISYNLLASGASTTTTVLKLISDGETVAFISDKSPPITVSATELDIQPNFSQIRKGITLSNTAVDGVSFNPGNTGLSTNHILWGTAASALGLVRSTGTNYTYVSAEDFLTRENLSESVGTVTIDDDEGLLLGASGVLKLHVTAPGNTANISVIGGDAATLRFNVYNGANQFYNIFSITTGTNNNPKILPNSTATVYLGTATQAFSYGYITNVIATNMTSTRIDGNEIYDNGSRVVTAATIGSNGVSSLTGTANKVSVNQSQGAVTVTLPNTLDITVQSLRSTGSSQVFGAWTLNAGATFQATYADLAERYAADAEYAPGTVLIIGGDAEVTTTDRHAHTAIAGIVSTNPAYTLNAQAGDDITHPYIALKGRVPCQVIGPIKKGDLLVTSHIPGYAEKTQDGDSPNAVLGRALEDCTTLHGIIEVMVV
jgi:hypothetical protein